MVELLSIISVDYSIVAITGRPNKWRGITERWIGRYRIPIDALYMRADDDYRPTPEVKMSFIVSHFGSIENAVRDVMCCFEDADKVIEAYRNAGFACHQVRPGGY